jgi:uncharacterized protein YjbJ (UPF0337 family)
MLSATMQTRRMNGSLYLEEGSMADDLEGKATHLGGKLKEGLGDLLGDRQMKTEGRLEQAEGVAEQDAARAERDLQEANLRKAAAERAQRNNGL